MQTVGAKIVDVVVGTLKAQTMALTSCDHAKCRASMPITLIWFAATPMPVFIAGVLRGTGANRRQKSVAIKTANVLASMTPRQYEIHTDG